MNLQPLQNLSCLNYPLVGFFLMSENVVSGLELLHICEAAGKSLDMNSFLGGVSQRKEFVFMNCRV